MGGGGYSDSALGTMVAGSGATGGVRSTRIASETCIAQLLRPSQLYTCR